MKIALPLQQVRMAAACALALGVLSGTAGAQTSAPLDRALVTDASSQVWINGSGECWRSAYGPAPVPSAKCDPNFKPVADAIAPVPAPTVEPVALAAVAPAPAREKVALDADALFAFNEAVLSPAGRESLDQFVKSIEDVDPATIRAVGYADRLGSETYNQTLSEKRVAAVKTYLVSQGIEAQNVQTEGRGKAEPVTQPGDCPGAKSAKLIACLQPDRRVELEVSGTRPQK